MTEIPTSLLDDNWDISPKKINVKDHPNKSHVLLILLLKRQLYGLADQIMQHYISNYINYIKSIFKQKDKTSTQTQQSLFDNIKLSIYEYISHQKKNDAINVMNHFDIHFNYTIYRCSIKADNYAIFDYLTKKGYPRNIKKHNDEIYHILNDCLNMTIMSQSTFYILICNIIRACSNMRISLYTYIRILKKGYYNVCNKIFPYVDINIWNGLELRAELQYLKNNMYHHYDHIMSKFQLDVKHAKQLL